MRSFFLALSALALAGCSPEKGTLDAYNGCVASKTDDGLTEASVKAICAAQEQVAIPFDPIDPGSTASIFWFEGSSKDQSDTASLKAKVTNATADKDTPYVITSLSVVIKLGEKEFEKRIDGIWIEPTIESEVVAEFSRAAAGENAQQPKTSDDWSWGVTAAQGLRID